MASALDVTQYILDSHGAMTTMKLQKLVYYAQAWSIVWDDNTLFDEPAWKAGPVVRALYEQHRGRFRVDTVGGNPGSLTGAQRDTIDLVLKFYGDKGAQWLSDLTHMEEPWHESTGGSSDNPLFRRLMVVEASADTIVSVDGLPFFRIDNPDTNTWYVKPFWRKTWSPIGATTLFGEFGQYNDQFNAGAGGLCEAFDGSFGTNIDNFSNTVRFTSSGGLLTSETIPIDVFVTARKCSVGASAWCRRSTRRPCMSTKFNKQHVGQSFEDWDLFQIGGIIFF